MDINDQPQHQLCHSLALPGHRSCSARCWSINSFCGMTWDLLIAVDLCCGHGAASEPGYPRQTWSWPAGWLHGLSLDLSPELNAMSSCFSQRLWHRLWLMRSLFYLLNLCFWLLIPWGPASLDSQHQSSVLLNLAQSSDGRNFSVFQVEVLIL